MTREEAAVGVARYLDMLKGEVCLQQMLNDSGLLKQERYLRDARKWCEFLIRYEAKNLLDCYERLLEAYDGKIEKSDQ